MRRICGRSTESAVPLDRGVEHGGEGVEDDADGRDLFDCEAEGYGDVGVRVDEVGCAVGVNQGAGGWCMLKGRHTRQ